MLPMQLFPLLIDEKQKGRNYLKKNLEKTLKKLVIIIKHSELKL